MSEQTDHRVAPDELAQVVTVDDWLRSVLKPEYWPERLREGAPSTPRSRPES